MIAIGADHGGLALKREVCQYLDGRGVAYRDFGVHSPESCDYAVVARAPLAAVRCGECDKALLFCGTGIGIAMAANKTPGIRAAVCSDVFSARHARLHNDANVLCLGGRVVGAGLACELVDAFLSAAFEGGRHQRRIDQLTELEQQR